MKHYPEAFRFSKEVAFPALSEFLCHALLRMLPIMEEYLRDGDPQDVDNFDCLEYVQQLYHFLKSSQLNQVLSPTFRKRHRHVQRLEQQLFHGSGEVVQPRRKEIHSVITGALPDDVRHITLLALSYFGSKHRSLRLERRPDRAWGLLARVLVSHLSDLRQIYAARGGTFGQQSMCPDDINAIVNTDAARANELRDEKRKIIGDLLTVSCLCHGKTRMLIEESEPMSGLFRYISRLITPSVVKANNSLGQENYEILRELLMSRLLSPTWSGMTHDQSVREEHYQWSDEQIVRILSEASWPQLPTWEWLVSPWRREPYGEVHELPPIPSFLRDFATFEVVELPNLIAAEAALQHRLLGSYHSQYAYLLESKNSGFITMVFCTYLPGEQEKDQEVVTYFTSLPHLRLVSKKSLRNPDVP